MSDAAKLEPIFRGARPRAVAALVRYFRAVDLAEDAFQEACLRGVTHWPDKGVPQDPTAWLILTGRNAGIDMIRRRSREETGHEITGHEREAEDLPDVESLLATQIDDAAYRDDVLRLLFMCCHDELSPQDQLALSLKIVVGFSVGEVARALLVAPKAMEQRITRAKKKAALVASRLETPGLLERRQRLDAVSTLVYLLFNQGYAATEGPDPIRQSLCVEAIRLARLLLGLFPSQPEVMGLLALCLFHHARVPARQDADGELVSLEDQDRRKWNRSEINEAKVLLDKALRHGQAGPFQVQAAISSLHCLALRAEETDWQEISALYAALERMQPSPVVTLNRLVARSKAESVEAVMGEMEEIGSVLDGYLYYHTALASFYAELGEVEAAQAAYDRALSLTPSASEAQLILAKRAALPK